MVRSNGSPLLTGTASMTHFRQGWRRWRCGCSTPVLSFSPVAVAVASPGCAALDLRPQQGARLAGLHVTLPEPVSSVAEWRRHTTVPSIVAPHCPAAAILRRPASTPRPSSFQMSTARRDQEARAIGRRRRARRLDAASTPRTAGRETVSL